MPKTMNSIVSKTAGAETGDSLDKEDGAVE